MQFFSCLYVVWYIAANCAAQSVCITQNNEPSASIGYAKSVDLMIARFLDIPCVFSKVADVWDLSSCRKCCWIPPLVSE